MLKKYGAQIQVKPVDLGGKIFPISGGLPLPQRAPQRQAYRLVELARWRDFLKMPLTLKPKFFPAPGDLSAGLIIAAKAHGEDAAMRLAWGIMKACWQKSATPVMLRRCRPLPKSKAWTAQRCWRKRKATRLKLIRRVYARGDRSPSIRCAELCDRR